MCLNPTLVKVCAITGFLLRCSHWLLSPLSTLPASHLENHGLSWVKHFLATQGAGWGWGWGSVHFLLALGFPSIQSRLDSSSEVVYSFLWTKAARTYQICRGKCVGVVRVQQVECPTWRVHPCNPIPGRWYRNTCEIRVTLL